MAQEKMMFREDTMRLPEPQISIHVLTSVHSYSTIKIIGSMGTRWLQLLIDSDSTHNFIDEKLASKLGRPMVDITTVQVGVANGDKLQCVKMCSKFQWMMQGAWFMANVLVIPLDNYNMVLGIQ